ncbi:PiggyBac transposable element-derived protein 3 [Elysia marginata]|uniref:PiggyBac transposable element-derived protein 3 n=1 Tax=Elysia marginata TaxID=1093978 RepID=A0AAV4F4W5_9GAST|nr:PiggyBac transposable element-derived protein 3 [Elysia marginata]
MTYDADELKILVAIIIIYCLGTSSLERRRMFWENAEDSHNQLVSSAMTVNRFDEILSILHLADTTKLDLNDKMAKVRPILSMLNERYLQFWPASQNVNVDKSMIHYYGGHSAKQFVRGKPIRYGYKMWCLNTPDGYLIQSEPYQGQGTVPIKPSLGMGGSVVVDLFSELPAQGFHVFTDNLFTSLALMSELRVLGIHEKGTLRANRTEKCTLTLPQAMKK